MATGLSMLDDTQEDHMPQQRTSARFATQLASQAGDWLRDRVLGDVLNRIQRLEAGMGAVTDALRAFRAQVDTESTRIGERIAALQARVDAGENIAAGEIAAELSGVVDTLRAMGTGSVADPLPEQPGDTEPVPAPGV